MVNNNWIYDMILYAYALSLLFYFSAAVGPNRSAKRMGTGLLAFVWLMQTVFLGYRAYVTNYLPVLTLFETVFLFVWLLVFVSLVMSWRMKADMVVFVTNLAGFGILAVNLFSDSAVPASSGQWEAQDHLLFIHITLAIGSYVAFLFGAIFSIIYLYLHRQLKGKAWSKLLTRFPSLDVVEYYTFRAVLIGAPLLMLSLVLGLVKIGLEGELRYMLDPKVLSSFILILAYVFYLVQRAAGNQPGYKLAKWNLAAFGLLLLNYVALNFLSRFHQWVWM
ncbi:cytochrome C assembly family protein [Paenibacillus koleovorans]|uniref:cytochrome C assembly family protein n=1 Tax=Paenibacillus koleovorans TaxID=121608 RepID=UPI000FD7A814|nr:cytochrome c biogenesis protein CcsA [Paenibacillus koleovorans]